jgi:hypothetical protein
MTVAGKTRMPNGVTLGVQHYPKGWAGSAQASAISHGESIEAWHAAYPNLNVIPHVNRHGDEPFVVYSWDDRAYYETPEEAFAGIVRIVMHDVRDDGDNR